MVGAASFFLAAGEEVVQCSVSRTLNIARINGEGKENSAYLFVGSAEPLLIPSITACETTDVFVQNCHGINETDTVQTHFHPLFPASLVFFFPYDYPLQSLVHFFHPQLAILPFILSQQHAAQQQLPGSDPQLSPHQATHSPWAFIKLSQPVAASA